ncbi:MAG: LamG-like jellyroll fold domain-containing protein [Tepidisphaerales bacterium]
MRQARPMTGYAAIVAAVALPASAALAQQLTDAALISNKNWASGGNTGYVITMDDRADGDLLTGRWKVNYRADGSTRVDTPNAWQPYIRGQWNHVVATFERFTFTLPDNSTEIRTRIETYLNGSRVSDAVNISGPGNIDTLDLGLNLNIGQDGTGNYRVGEEPGGFVGRIDDVAVWRRAITQTEVTALWNGRNGGGSLSVLAGTSPALANELVGLYTFDNHVLDTASTLPGRSGVTPKNGIWREIGEGGIDNPSVAAYTSGLFGQAASLNGSNYITIGDALAGFPTDYTFGSTTSFSFSAWFFEPIPQVFFSRYTNASGNGLASNPANWDSVPPAEWNNRTAIFVGGPTAAENNVTFDTALGSRIVSYFEFGAAGQTTNITFEPGASVIGQGTGVSVIGVPGSTVNLTINSGVLNHWGDGEERRRLAVGAGSGAFVNITLDGTGELSVGNRVADASFATGFRRPELGGADGQPRRGDDVLLGDGPNGAVTLTMNGNSFMFVTDVMYVGDSDSTSPFTAVQNGNSTVIVNWDTRWADDGAANGKVISWTMNDNSRFIVARDHGLSEANGAGTGTINLTINDNAEFAAGDRLVFGAGGRHNVNVTLNGGLVRAGRLTPGPDLLVDNTGVPAGPARDNILLMGLNSNVNFTINGGLVSIQRSAWVGFNGGTALLDMHGGTFNILGIGSADLPRLGNFPDTMPFPQLGAANTSAAWVDGGGDLYISIGGTVSRSAPIGIVRVGGDATLNVARDVLVGGTYYNASFTGVTPPGIAYAELAVRGDDATINIGGNLVFGGVSFGNSANYIVGGNVTSVLGARLTGPNHAPINVTGAGGRNGDLVIYSSNPESGTGNEKVTSVIDVTIDVPYAVFRPSNGDSFTLVQYAGSRLRGGNGDGVVPNGRQGTFDRITDSSVNGIDWTVQYDDANKRLNVVASKVYRLGNTDRDAADTVTTTDFDQLVAGFGSTGTKRWADGDFTNDRNVDLEDFSIQRAAYDNAVGSPGSLNVPHLIVFEDGRTLLQADGLSAGLQVKSASGGLSTAAFNALQLTSLVGSGAVALSSTSSDVAAASLTGQVSLAGTTDLGQLAAPGVRDLAFAMTLIGNLTATYVPGNVAYLIRGDFNFDSIVDAGDIDVLLEAVLEATPFQSFISTYGDAFTAAYGATLDATVLAQLGDLDGNNLFDAEDIDAFITAILAARPGGSAIPEPAMLGLVAPAAVLLTRRRR